MKVSIVTITYNSSKTIEDSLRSVANQTHKDIEHILIDGKSSDNTVEIIKSYTHVTTLVSEKDSGIYNAMNKGLKLATGEIVGILNSDDFLAAENTIEEIVKNFPSESDAIIGDIAFVRPDNLSKIIRYYSSKSWNPNKFKWGFMPPHPSFYLRNKFYKQYGYYKEDYVIAADYELLIRMLYTKKLKYKYLPLQIVTMRTGGVSTQNIKSRYILNKEIVRGCKENNINTNMLFLTFKYFKKVFEYVNPNPNKS